MLLEAKSPSQGGRPAVNAQSLELIRMLEQGVQARRHGVTRGVVSRRDQEREEVLEFQFRERVFVAFGLQQPRDHVVARCVPAQSGLLCGVLEQF